VKLLRFKVTNFRCIKDSGWINLSDLSVFVGEHGSGKTSLFLGLIKLTEQVYLKSILNRGNALKYMRINLDEDLPTIDGVTDKLMSSEVFIEATFSLDKKIMDLIRTEIPYFPEVNDVTISKTFNGKYVLDATAYLINNFDKGTLLRIILSNLPPFVYFEGMTEVVSDINLISLANKILSNNSNLTINETVYANLLSSLDIWESNLIKSLSSVYGELNKDKEESLDFSKVFLEIPLFYSRFKKGIESLNTRFAKWSGITNIKLDFEPITNGIRLFIIDETGRKVLLEKRNHGFRRFLGLFLSLTVPQSSTYNNAIILIDDAGLGITGMSQEKLRDYLVDYSETSQVLYSTYSPLMIPIKRLDDVFILIKDLYSNISISKDFSLREDFANDGSLRTIKYAVALSTIPLRDDSFLPILVLEESHKNYLEIMKIYLQERGKIRTFYSPEIFTCSKNSLETFAQLYRVNNNYPLVVLESNRSGREIKARLCKYLYADYKEKVNELDDFDRTTIYFEDLFPLEIFEEFAKNYIRSITDDGFIFIKNVDCLSQIRQYAKAHNHELPADYLVVMSRKIRNNMLRYQEHVRIPADYIRLWAKLWNKLLSDN
jgi:hypothetical protein